MSTSAAQRRFEYQPALDGVRAVAVGLVLLFHQGWLSGGYVGVSVFFTLSGYLLTSLALAEHDATGRLDVGAFYGRRARRLLPASLACLAAVAALARWGVFDGVEHLRRDLWAAAGQVYNWVALGSDQTYAQLVAGTEAPRSPVDHYWSLAVEEQFYWLWPLALVVILRCSVRGRAAAVAGLTMAAAVAAALIAAAWGGDAAYWATPARLAEILVGALLAVVLRARRSVGPLPRILGLVGAAGLGAVLGAAVTWPSASGPAYSGWLPAFALASAALILGLQVPGPLRLGLGWRPLVALGVISYGVYLVHWPVYVVLDEQRTGLPAIPLFAVRLGVTIGVAAASYRWLERPIRIARPRPLVVPIAATASLASVVLVVALLPADATPYWMASAGGNAAALAVSDTVAPPAGAVSSSAPAAVSTTVPAALVVPSLPASAPARPVRILVVGDSTAVATAQGLTGWAAEHRTLARVDSAAVIGCGFIATGRLTSDADGQWGRICRDADAVLPDRVAAARPDVVVGMVTLSDVDSRAWDPTEGPLTPTDDRFYQRLVAAYDETTAMFLTSGASDVLWLVPPIPTVPDPRPADDSARYDGYAAALAAVAARHPGQVTVVDVPAWMAARPQPPDRPDGLHWSPSGSRQLADGLLGPLAVAAGMT